MTLTSPFVAFPEELPMWTHEAVCSDWNTVLVMLKLLLSTPFGPLNDSRAY